MDISNQSIGRAGEFQAATIFELHGIVSTHVDIHGVDLWVQTPSGRRVTVQVKSSMAPVQNELRRTTPRYAFSRKRPQVDPADVYCFVALDLCLMRLCSGAELGRSVMKYFSAPAFTQENMEADLRRYLY